MIALCEDWRTLPAAAVDPLLDAEVRAWQASLDWDVRDAWSVIGPARAAGHLPGLTLRDRSGRVTGWTCFLLHRRALQVATLVADTPEATAALVDGIFASPEAASAQTGIVCVRDAAPGLREVLAARRFSVATYRYLRTAALTGASIGDPAPMVEGARPWRAGDQLAVARLCARAYAGARDVRAFAPHGAPEDWDDYLASLVVGGGCGRFLARASFVVPGAAGEIEAAVVTTDLGTDTAHIAQVAVNPGSRRRGLGGRLVASALAAAAADGLTRATLLVADGNVPARALYDRLGFQEHATFIVGVKRL